MYDLRCAQGSSHSNNLKFRGAGCRFSKCARGMCSGHVGIGKNVLALRLCSETFCGISPRAGAGTPERVGRGYCLSVFSCSIQLTGDRWGQWTGGPYESLHAVRPVASADSSVSHACQDLRCAAISFVSLLLQYFRQCSFFLIVRSTYSVFLHLRAQPKPPRRPSHSAHTTSFARLSQSLLSHSFRSVFIDTWLFVLRIFASIRNCCVAFCASQSLRSAVVATRARRCARRK